MSDVYWSIAIAIAIFCGWFLLLDKPRPKGGDWWIRGAAAAILGVCWGPLLVIGVCALAWRKFT